MFSGGKVVDEVVIGNVEVGGSIVFLEGSPRSLRFVGPRKDVLPDDGIASHVEVVLKEFKTVHGDFNGIFGHGKRNDIVVSKRLAELRASHADILSGRQKESSGLLVKLKVLNIMQPPLFELGGDVLFCEVFGYVTERHFTKIGKVGLLGEFVPFGGKDAFASMSLHGNAEAAHARKEVDEGEIRMDGVGEGDIEEIVENSLPSRVFHDVQKVGIGPFWNRIRRF